ncbi:MAG TPA: NAD(P)-dependent oxidoreductase [Micromonosporaceae bacterium]|nr:NAD(P)-dependent oxidoreductase [Micromonosporaceae bacterium]
MRVLVAGATGVIGRQLVPLLAASGHDVIGLARSRARAAVVEQTGAEVVVADALDRSAVARVVRDAAPDAVVHALTAIPAEINPKRLAQDFALTNRLRTEGTRNLLDAAAESGVKRVITQGLAYAYDPAGDGAANEDVPFWQDPPKQFAPVLAALQELEQLTAQANGLVLRFGHLYGPGSIYDSEGSFVRQVRAGKVPLVGKGTATFSFTHAHDAASAVVAALDKNVTGALNVVDDEPAPMSEWLPFLAQVLNAKAPKGAPAALAKLAVGGWGVAFMTQLRGADNARARMSLDWRPRYGSWREGFTAELG